MTKYNKFNGLAICNFVVALFIIFVIFLGVVFANNLAPHDMNCTVVEDQFFNIYRCQNDEVICYFMQPYQSPNKMEYSNLICKFK